MWRAGGRSQVKTAVTALFVRGDWIKVSASLSSGPQGLGTPPTPASGSVATSTVTFPNTFSEYDEISEDAAHRSHIRDSSCGTNSFSGSQRRTACCTGFQQPLASFFLATEFCSCVAPETPKMVGEPTHEGQPQETSSRDTESMFASSRAPELEDHPFSYTSIELPQQRSPGTHTKRRKGQKQQDTVVCFFSKPEAFMTDASRFRYFTLSLTLAKTHLLT
ncbi:hypothetical protein QBC47DRAFT_191166 [Echria macrotheca]|uniref:Uncharacterized protein n=1 Tax=Echria macrotheca TaxID=438768 RepID=A0AAJ0BC42_9PEZI|nr:hypothetical protein QBC47DRAFT_191166 [Echria macrotheca]